MTYMKLKRIKREWLGVAMGLCLLVTASCSDFLDVESRHAATEQQQWQTLEDTRAALMGVYGLMRAALAENNTHWVCGDLRLGDFTATERTDLQAIVNNNLDLNIPLVNRIADWKRFYAVVNAASVFIENAAQVVEKDQAYSEQNLAYDVAQVRALRAFAYFCMTRIWGDVPLITYSYDDGTFPQAARTDVRSVLAYVKQELTAVIDQIPFMYGDNNNKYYRQEPNYWQGILLNKLSIAAILAHVSALAGNYSDAGTYATYVIENCAEVGIKQTSPYVPVSDLVSPVGFFLGSNSTYKPYRLVAFNFLDANGESTQDGHLEQWTLAAPYVQKAAPDLYVSRDSLVNIFDNVDDTRFGIDTATVTYNNIYVDMTASFPIFKKINVVQDGSDKTNDYAVFGSTLVFTRLEELMLLRAEALVMQNRPTEALTQLNALRSQRGLAQLSYLKDLGSDKMQLLDAVFAERRRELMGEGWRWYDLIRRQKIRRDNPELLQMIEAGGEYWPVSPEVLKQNPSVSQNEYWAKLMN